MNPMTSTCLACGYPQVWSTTTEASSIACSQCGHAIYAGTAVPVEAAMLKTAIAQDSQPVLVDIWAQWCGPCKGMLPVFDALAAEVEPGARVLKLEMSNPQMPDNDEWVKQFGVRSVPTVILFSGGEDIAGFAGTATLAQLKVWLQTHGQSAG